MSYATGNCTEEDLPSWEDFVDPIDGDYKPKENCVWSSYNRRSW